MFRVKARQRNLLQAGSFKQRKANLDLREQLVSIIEDAYLDYLEWLYFYENYYGTASWFNL